MLAPNSLERDVGLKTLTSSAASPDCWTSPDCCISSCADMFACLTNALDHLRPACLLCSWSVSVLCAQSTNDARVQISHTREFAMGET